MYREIGNVQNMKHNTYLFSCLGTHVLKWILRQQAVVIRVDLGQQILLVYLDVAIRRPIRNEIGKCSQRARL